jgi:PAS domain S-box-containing protein
MDAATLLRLEHAVADVIDLGAADDVFPQILASVGTALAWAVGGVWLPERNGSLRLVVSWHAPDFPAGSTFLETAQKTSLESGVGLPGRVLESGQPAWISDARTDPNFPRAEAAKQAGLASAFCFPLVSADGIEGCVEFFADRVLDPSDEVLATTASLGRRVGEALRRHRQDEAVRRSEARLRAVLEAALDCVIIADGHGTVLEFNPAACVTFRLSREQAVGQNLSELIVPPSLRARHRAGLARYLRTEEPHVLDHRIEITGMRSDGSEFPVELTITRIAAAGPPVFAGYLRDLTERRRAEEEIRASRHRVVQAVVEERQRLERDLHDGAQQRLISVGTALARARTVLPGEPHRAAAILDEAIVGLEQAAIELRDLARGIHPVSLTRYGLATVLGEVARRSPIDLVLGTMPAERYPLAVEATAYFVISEGLTNIARYAGTHRATVDVGVEDASLVVIVGDEGRGGASFEGGTGLRGLADRVAMLDGTFDVDSPPGGGTRLRARIPISA